MQNPPRVEQGKPAMLDDASPLALGTLGIAIAAVAVFWRWTISVVGLTQSAGYSALSLLTGVRFVDGFAWAQSRKVEAWAWFRLRTGWWPAQLTTLALGTVTPSIVGLVLARGVYVGWEPATVLTVLLILLGLLVLIHADWFTLFVIVFLAGLIAVFIYLAGPAAQFGAVVTLSWILLLGGLRLAAEQAGYKHKDENTGPGILQDITDIPAALWVLGFLFIALSAFIAGARWLLAA